MLTPERVAARTAGNPADQDVIDVVNAVNAFVNTGCPDAPRVRDDSGQPTDEWAPDTDLAALMLAARLVRRRNSPSGTEAFADGGAVYVSRQDPDVAQLLRLGPYAPPKIG